MREFVLEDGGIITEDELNALGDACERGDYPGRPGEWIVRPVGRPASANPLVNVTVRMTEADRARIDARARETGRTRSQLVRDAIAAAIA